MYHQLSVPCFAKPCIGDPPLSCELDDEQELHSPTERDLDLARHLEPSLREDYTKVFTDGRVCYYATEVTIPNPRRTLRNNADTVRAVMWIRSGTVCYSGYPFEPDDYDEALIDSEQVFSTLSDAIKQTKLDELAYQLDQIDNHCGRCCGAGHIEEIDGDYTCTACSNKGWIPMPKPETPAASAA